jgi:hypothetical protein
MGSIEMSDEGRLVFADPNETFTITKHDPSSRREIFRITADGKKMRDGQELKDLSREALLALIDDLIAQVRGPL